jgi:protein required for attachment to host cells
MRTWILLADAGNARLYASNKLASDWTLVREFSHPEARQHAADLVSDKQGETRQSATGARSAMEPRTPLKKKEAEKFAHELAEALQKGLDQQAYERLVLVAAPHFLGLLREALPARVSEKISDVVEKDYLHLDEPKLKERLEEQLAPRRA